MKVAMGDWFGLDPNSDGVGGDRDRTGNVVLNVVS